MRDEAKALADARTKLEEQSASLALLRRGWEESVAGNITAVEEAKAAVSIAEENLRKAGLAYYTENPDTKKLPFGLNVRITSTLEYSTDNALAWAVEHKMALSLDKKAFESIAKTHNVPFVTKKEVVTVTLPTDTAKLLQENPQ